MQFVRRSRQGIQGLQPRICGQDRTSAALLSPIGLRSQKRYDLPKMTQRDETRALDALLDEILTDAYGDDEQLWALHAACEDRVALPADAYVIGEPISVIGFDYDGNERRGLTATCRREDGGDYVVSLPDVHFPPSSEGARYVAAYRKWLGLDSLPDSGAPVPQGPVDPAVGRARRKRPPLRRRHHATESDLDLSGPVELIVLSVKKKAARCLIPGTDREISLRAQVWRLVPGEIATVRPRKQWSYAGHPYLSGEIEASRLDVPALGLTSLVLSPTGTWDPSLEYWGEEPLDECFQPIVASGPRPQFEMEQVLPGADPSDPFGDPLIEAGDLSAAGDVEGARRLLMELLRADLRCLDAHAHLGNFEFDHLPQQAIRHYEVGVRIGELALDNGFSGVLPWGFIDNRPFLRCLHGYGLCLWKLGRVEEAAAVFERMLWLNPTDNQGVRFLIRSVKAGEEWRPDEEEY